MRRMVIYKAKLPYTKNMITLLLVGALSVFTYQHNTDIKTIKSDNVSTRQIVQAHEERITTAEDTLVTHRKALDYLHSKQTSPKAVKIAPTADWMANL